MPRRPHARTLVPILAVACLAATAPISAQEAPGRKPEAIPVRGIHLMAPYQRKDYEALTEFVRGPLAREGVNTLILEVDLSFDFKSRPEFAEPSAPGKEDLRRLAAVCREKGIALIPQLSCLGHQSWSKNTGRFLQKHPELDETPGKYPENKDIYCRSYCPLHPDLHGILFPLIDELVDACESKAFHAGMDEVFILADKDCPRCKGKDPAALFAGEVTAIRDHLKAKGRRLWMWGDRFLDGKATGIGEWEASTNGTAKAVDLVPKDIVICDWHYEKAHDTPRHFAEKGFDVVACPWRKTDVALGLLERIRALRAGAGKDDPKAKESAARALGVVQTTWVGAPAFLKAYVDLLAPPPEAGAKGGKKGGADAAEAAACFRALFKALREGK